MLGEQEPAATMARPASRDPDPADTRVPGTGVPGTGVRGTGVPATGVVTCRLGPFDQLEASAAWNLAAAHAVVAGPTTWISDSPWAGARPSPPESEFQQIVLAGPDLENGVVSAESPSVWLGLPEGSPEREEWLGATLQFVSREPGSRSRCFRRLEETAGGKAATGSHWVVALASSPSCGATDGATLAAEIRDRFGDLAQVFPRALACEAALYRSWVTRLPIAQFRPESRETVALFQIARAISVGASEPAASGR